MKMKILLIISMLCNFDFTEPLSAKPTTIKPTTSKPTTYKSTSSKPITSKLTTKSTTSKTTTLFIGSTILSNKLGIQLANLTNLPLKKSPFKLIYQASKDGFSAGSFHSKCDGVLGTFFVIKSDNLNIFGGYTSVDWSGEKYFKNDPSAFLYSLVNSYKTPVKLNILSYEQNNAITASSSYSVTFGRGSDLECYGHDNKYNKCYSHLGSSYQTPSFLPMYSSQTESFFGGGHEFNAVEIEGYSIFIDPCSSPRCENGGVCLSRINNYTCTCKNGFYGSNCQYKKLNSTIFKNSTILTIEQSVSLINLISLNQTDQLANKTWKMIFQASRDGFNSNSFHSKCDGFLGTLTVIKSVNKTIFGGYTEADWSSNYKNHTKAFLFSLVNSYNTPVKMNAFKPIYDYDWGFGPRFGEDLDIELDSLLGRSDLGRSYQLPSFLTMYGVDSKQVLYFLGGGQYFQIAEVEVYFLLI